MASALTSSLPPPQFAKPMLNIGGTATSINKVISGIDKEGNLYNLAGQRVSKNTKGLLIKNGKKFINK